MSWAELVVNIGSPIVQAAATVFAAGTAIWGVRAWRKEYIGKRRIDLAEEVLAIVYEARDVLEAARSLVGYPDEGKTREVSADEIGSETGMLNQAFVQIERCNRRGELFAQLRSLRYRFMAQHGGESGKLFEELDATRRSLAKPFYSLQIRTRELRRKRKEMNEDQYNEELGKLWSQWQEEQYSEFDKDGNDLVLKRADAVVQEFERICRQTTGD